MQHYITDIYVCLMCLHFFIVHGYNTFSMQDCVGDKSSFDIPISSGSSNSSGILVSSENPAFQPGRHCVATLKTPLKYGVVISVRSLDLKPQKLNSSYCENYLEISTNRLCGYSNDVHEAQSYTIWSNNVDIIFHTANSSKFKNAAFQITFTAAKKGSDLCYSYELECLNNNCIWTGLTCDGHNNCGDLSDESNMGIAHCSLSLTESLIVILVVIIGSLAFIVIVAYFRWPKITEQLERLIQQGQNSSQSNEILTSTNPESSVEINRDAFNGHRSSRAELLRSVLSQTYRSSDPVYLNRENSINNSYTDLPNIDQSSSIMSNNSSSQTNQRNSRILSSNRERLFYLNRGNEEVGAAMYGQLQTQSSNDPESSQPRERQRSIFRDDDAEFSSDYIDSGRELRRHQNYLRGSFNTGRVQSTYDSETNRQRERQTSAFNNGNDEFVSEYLNSRRQLLSQRNFSSRPQRYDRIMSATNCVSESDLHRDRPISMFRDNSIGFPRNYVDATRENGEQNCSRRSHSNVRLLISHDFETNRSRDRQNSSFRNNDGFGRECLNPRELLGQRQHSSRLQSYDQMRSATANESEQNQPRERQRSIFRNEDEGFASEYENSINGREPGQHNFSSRLLSYRQTQQEVADESQSTQSRERQRSVSRDDNVAFSNQNARSVLSDHSTNSSQLSHTPQVPPEEIWIRMPDDRGHNTQRGNLNEEYERTDQYFESDFASIDLTITHNDPTNDLPPRYEEIESMPPRYDDVIK